jgi:hypothetical protein
VFNQSLVLLLLVSQGSFADVKHLSVSDIPKEIRTGAPRKLADYLFKDEHRHEQTLREISSGSAAWLEIYPQIILGTDAGWTEEMLSSLAGAIDRNPAGALRAMSKVAAKDARLGEIVIEACGITPESTASDENNDLLKKSSIKRLESRLSLVANIKDKLFAGIKEKCAKEIRKTLTSWKS